METNTLAIFRAAAERSLPSLLIGGNAIILLGYLRNTVDLHLLIPAPARSRWLDLLRELGYRFYNGTVSFAQFEAPRKAELPVDLMIVAPETWEKLIAGAREVDLGGECVRIPRPEFLVALKLHAASSPTRSKPETDWEDIRQIVRICHLDPAEVSFRQVILRYGGENGLARIQRFFDEKQ